MNSWYAIYTKPRQESVAEANLRRQGFHVWLPCAIQSRRRRGRWIDLVEPLFPRYLFIRIHLGAEDVSPIRSTRGVTGFVRFGLQPSTVPNSVIEVLQNAANPETGLHRIRHTGFRKRERVRVIEGPFNGLKGIFEAEKGEDRVTVLLGMLGGNAKVTLSGHQVRSNDGGVSSGPLLHCSIKG